MTRTVCHTLPYPIYVGHGLLSTLPTIVPELAQAHRVAVITDSNVGPLHAAALVSALGASRTTLVSIAAGEQHKTRETWTSVTDTLLRARLGRDSVVVALGGGVVGDLAGFVAATYLRGIPVVQAPTSLLAMVDASIGGKVGVDTPAGKNRVGAFHPPLAVVADVDMLATLPHEQRRSGLAEALKHGVIADAAYFASLVSSAGKPADWGDIVRRSVEIKASIVALDEREDGIRKTLNFGHTIGHAIELVSGYALPHGHCVAIGMICETRIAAAMRLCDAALVSQIRDAVADMGLPTEVPASLSLDAVLAATATDKKSRRGLAEYTLPTSLGQMATGDGRYGIRVSADVQRTALRST